MTGGNESFVFYKSFYEAIRKLPAENQLELYNAIAQYSLDRIEPNILDKTASAIFTLVKHIIDNSQNNR